MPTYAEYQRHIACLVEELVPEDSLVVASVIVNDLQVAAIIEAGFQNGTPMMDVARAVAACMHSKKCKG